MILTPSCILSKFYIKPQRYDHSKSLTRCCILSKFYIKPQPFVPAVTVKVGCILSKFYIKPQRNQLTHIRCRVVSYRNSTSNHNFRDRLRDFIRLYLIEILHQTTTAELALMLPCRCILSKFYIKPQHSQCHFVILGVVSYRNSTSNHNISFGCFFANTVVSYRNSTSNHNTRAAKGFAQTVVSYRNSTSNHNVSFRLLFQRRLYLIEILHQTTTLGLILIDKVLLTGCLPL